MIEGCHFSGTGAAMEDSGISVPGFDGATPTRGASPGPAARSAPRRPRPVIFASIALVDVGLLGVLLTWLLLSLLNAATDHGQSVNAVFYGLCYLQFALSGTQIASGLFVWSGRQPWARIAAIVICSVNLLGGVVSLFAGSCLPGLFNLALNIGLIRVLTNDEVYDWCHGLS
jgi:hypothetical protein